MFVPLYFTPGISGIQLRGLTGSDELSVVENNTAGVLGLIRVLALQGTENEVFEATRIVTADRDRLIAHLYISLYGEKISSTIDCTGCGQKFDLDFSLDSLLRHFRPDQALIPRDGIYEAEPGIRFRLPTGADEMAIRGYHGQSAEMMLLERCMISEDPAINGEKVQLRMAEVAPVLSQEMNAECPECSRVQKVLFDMQSYFMTRLIRDKKKLHEEIHLIAGHYHWSHREILDLPMFSRKQYVSLINGN